MKKSLKGGFFLSETIVVISICAIVLLGVFDVYSSAYSKYKANEKYNTPNSILAISAISNYYSSVKSVNINEIIDDENEGKSDSEKVYFLDITNYFGYQSDYLTKLIEVYSINNIYLIDLDRIDIYDESFDYNARKYLSTVKKYGGVVLLLSCNINEFTYKSLTNYGDIKLSGDPLDEYAIYLNINDDYVEPDNSYTGYTGIPIISCEANIEGCVVLNNVVTLDTSKENTYYIYYNFEGKILRRKVVIQK